ncbi:MAG: ABC transporter permease [Christensenella sp.]|nr:ABC transporter permease [Christensenella sp.]
MNRIVESFRKFRRQPAFTGFILFISVVVLNVIMQGVSTCKTGGFTFQNFFAFFSPVSLNTIIMTNMPFILVTIGQAILLIVGQMDISIGVQIAMVNVICIMVPQELGAPVWVGWVVAIVASILISAIAGFACSVLRLPALLASYALTYAIKGINILIMPTAQGSVPKAFWKPYQSTVFKLFDKDWVKSLGEGAQKLLGILNYIPVAVFVLIAVLISWRIISRTRFGKHIYAVGSNPRNAFAAAISPVGTQMKAFLIKGIYTGIAGICLTLMTASGNPLQCEDYGIRSLSAAIIGGMGWGGWGSVACGVFGSGFLVLIQNTVYYFFTLLSKIFSGFAVSSYWQNLVSDLIIFGGLLMTIVTAKAQRETLKQGLKQQFKRGESYGK